MGTEPSTNPELSRRESNSLGGSDCTSVTTDDNTRFQNDRKDSIKSHPYSHKGKAKKNRNVAAAPETNRFSPNNTVAYLLILDTIFAVGNILADLLGILTVCHCYDSYNKRKYIALLCFHIIKMIYVILQLGFLQIFTNISLKYTTEISATFNGLKYIISMILGTNIGLWAVTLLQFNGILKGGTGQDYNGEYDELKTLPYFKCMNSSMFSNSRTITIYLNPFELEYLVVSSTILLSIFPRRSKVDNRMTEQLTTGRPEKARKDVPESFAVVPDEEQTCNWGLIVGIPIGLVTIATAININAVNIHYAYDVLSHYIVKSFCDLLIIALTTLVYCEVKKSHVRVRRGIDSGYRLFYIAALCGYMPFHLFCLAAVVLEKTECKRVNFLHEDAWKRFNRNLSTIKVCMFIHSLCNMISPVYQAIVLSKCHLYGRQPNRGSSSSRIREYLLCLLAVNLSCWVFNSFIQLNARLGMMYLVSESVFGDKLNGGQASSPIWFIVTSICNPITIFYRIHAAAMIVGLWFTFRAPSNNY